MQDMQEDSGFDKFMDDLLIKERQQVKRDATDEEISPQAKRMKQRRENVGFLIHYNSGK
jgi:hypothetical protein